MTTPTTVAILAGGFTHERSVSLRSARRVASDLREAGFQTKVLDVDGNLLARFNSMSPTLAWPLVHGVTGEDGAIQSLLELSGIPYIGSTTIAARLASNKTVAQSLLRDHNIQVPRSLSIPEALFREVGVTGMLSLIEENFGRPLVTKPAVGGSSLGVTAVDSVADLPRAMVDCFAYYPEAHLEEFVSGREIAVSLAEIDGELVVLPPVEIQVSEGLYDYEARYEPGRAEYYIPADLTETEQEALRDSATAAFRTLGLRDLARIDYILGERGPVLIDINIAPGMTETSLLPLAASNYAHEHGLETRDIYASIVRGAYARIQEVED